MPGHIYNVRYTDIFYIRDNIDIIVSYRYPIPILYSNGHSNIVKLFKYLSNLYFSHVISFIKLYATSTYIPSLVIIIIYCFSKLMPFVYSSLLRYLKIRGTNKISYGITCWIRYSNFISHSKYLTHQTQSISQLISIVLMLSYVVYIKYIIYNMYQYVR